jgi:pimeloyl-ACP methyl ester carboxylesterase
MTSVTHDEVVVAEGVTLHSTRVGDGPLMLFLHGFPECWLQWRTLQQHFAARGHRAVAPDLRGYNRSSRPAAVADYRMHVLTEDVRRLARHYGDHPFVLVGHDWGGFIAWAFAAQHPELVKRLIIINAPHPIIYKREVTHNPAQQAASAYIAHLVAPDSPALLADNDCAWLMANCLTRSLRKGFIDEHDVAAYRSAWTMPGALLGMTHYYRAVHEEVFRLPGPTYSSEWLPGAPANLTINVPTLVIWGEWDRALLLGNLDGLEAHVPDLTLVRVPGATHWIVTEMPARVAVTMDEWLARPSRAAGQTRP